MKGQNIYPIGPKGDKGDPGAPGSSGTGGGVASVGATAPVTSTGGDNPVIGITTGTGPGTVAAGNDARLSLARALLLMGD